MSKQKRSSNLLSQLFFGLILFCVFPLVSFATDFGAGREYTYTVSSSGYYKLEAWGSQGGGNGGYGAYAIGVTYLRKGTILYINAGGIGSMYDGGYNGGGNSGRGNNQAAYGGGGATSIATKSGLLSTLSSKTSDILLVAAGGGGGCQASNCTNGHGGGIQGVVGYDIYNRNSSAYNGTGATSTSGGYNYNGGIFCGRGSFGKGGNFCNQEYGGAGGGGGYYGGGGSSRGHASGGGGSSYVGNSKLISYGGITKATYCYSCTNSTAANTKTVSTTAVNATPTSYQAKKGTGYARITLLTAIDPRLKTLTFSEGTLDKAFNPDVHEYNAVFDSEKSYATINATPMHEDSVIAGAGAVDILKGNHDIIITCTSSAGDVTTYTIHTTRPQSSYKYLSDMKISGKTIDGFKPEKLKYEINIPYDQEELKLEVVKGRASQELYLPTDLKTISGTNQYKITVVSEDGVSTTEYTLVVNRAHTSKLKSLINSRYDLSPTFDPETLNYTVHVMSNTMSLTWDATPYDEEATVKVEGFGYIKDSSVGKITVTEPNSSPTIYTITVDKDSTATFSSQDFPYTGAVQTFTAPTNGYYQLEAWGSQGGGNGGYGAYSTGVVYLVHDETIYIQVGGTGAKYNGGYNGGGIGGYGNLGQNAYGGGGATSIARKTGLLSSLSSSKDSVLLVAAGGGGGCQNANCTNGHGGGIKGVVGYDIHNRTSVHYNGTGASLTSGGYNYFGGSSCGKGSFGKGGNYCNLGYGGAGGGAGYYGGGGSSRGHASGAGGSSYTGSADLVSYDTVTKATYCYGCTTSNGENTLTFSTNFVNSSPASNQAKKGTGYARVRLLRMPSEDNFLSSLTVKATNFETNQVETKAYTPTYEKGIDEYSITLDEMETSVTLSAKPSDSKSSITGLGTFDVPAGTTDFEIQVTAESKDVRTYTIHVTRPASTRPYPFDITISGLVSSLCSKNDAFCKLSPTKFDKDTNSYYITVPSRIKQLWFNVAKGHPYQVVNGEGKVSLNGGENPFTISVTSEDDKNTNVYHYYVTRDMSGNTDLSKLDVIDPKREINYDPDVMEYYLSVPNDYTSIRKMEIETDDENARYIVTGNEEFKVGMNEVLITVTAANGEIRAYVLNVYREKNENVYLKDLKVKHGTTNYPITPVFNKINLGTYQTVVPNDVTEVELVAVAEASTTLVTGTGKKTLNTGINQFSIVTTAENGTVETYTLEITREKNSNADLSGIMVASGGKDRPLSPTFHKDTLDYTVNVPEGTSEVSITATTSVQTTNYKLLDNNSIKVGENIKRVMAIAEDGTSKTYTIKVVRPANSDCYLKDITLSHGALSPTFEKTKKEYTLEVENEVTELTITGIKENILSTVTGNGKYALSVGENEISLTVTSESGSVNTYIIKVKRKPSSNAYLKLITTSEGVLVPEFSKDQNEYTMTVSHPVSKIQVIGTPEASTTSVSGNGDYDLSVGTNEIELVTLAEDKKTTLTYKIVVKREKSSNANLSHLLLEEAKLDPEFKKDVTSYKASVPYEVNKGMFHVTPEDENATYEIIGNTNFEVGENTVTIRVTAEDKTVKDYVVVVTRQEDVTNSDYLIHLSVNKGTLTPSFEKKQQYYEVDVPYEISEIVVSATPEDQNASVNGTGTYALDPGNNLATVQVISADGKTRDYQILIRRGESSNAKLSSVVIEDAILTPSFQSDIFEYHFTTTVSLLHFTQIVPVEENATYEIIGNTGFTDSGDYTVTIQVTAPDQTTKQDYVFHVTKEASNNNNLASLKILGYEINPEFHKATTLYTATVPSDVNSVMIEATAEDEMATVTGDGNQLLVTGENYLVVQVTSASGKVKSYTIVLTKEGSSNLNVTDLIVHNGTMTPSYTTEKDSYDVVVDYEEESLDLEVILESDKASYEVKNNTLAVGDNTVEVVVTAENGSTKTITLHVKRNEIVSALLESLSVNGYELSPNFVSYITNYSLLVNYETESLNLNIKTLDPKATYEVIGNENFVVGKNLVQIVVTASDQVTKETYTLEVTRQKYANTYLDYLYTSEGDLKPEFKKETMEYHLQVGNEVESIEFFGEAEDKSSTVTGLGKHNLNVGENKFKVIVTSISGVTRDYLITVTREKDTNRDLESLVVKNGATIYDLAPEFSKDVQEYTVTVPVGTLNVTIDGEVKAPATVTGFGTKTIVAGENTFEVVVTSEAGETKTYTIHVNRGASNNNHLIRLIPSVGSLEPEFTYEGTSYTIHLGTEAALLSFDVVTEDPYATVSGAEGVLVPDGESTRNIVITAEDGSERTITVTVIKERGDNARLKSFSVDGYSFTETFDPAVLEYHITVPNHKKILQKDEVHAEVEDENATFVKSENLNLSTKEENVFVVTVTAPDGFTKQHYKIFVKREKGDNALLNSLTVKKGKLESTFNPEVFEYTWTVPKNSILTASDIVATAQDRNASILKTERLEVVQGATNKYIVKVTSEDGSKSKEYVLKIAIDLTADTTLVSLAIDKGYYEPEFQSNIKVYDAYEYVDTDYIVVTATPTSSDSKVTSGNGMVPLESQDTHHEIVITAEDGTTDLYVLNIHKTILREEGLADLSLNGLNPDSCGTKKCMMAPSFDTDVTSYSITVPNDYTELDISAIPMNDQQTIKFKKGESYFENYSLMLGKNEILIEVYDGMMKKTKTYTLIVNRAKSSNNYLQSLYVDGYDLSPSFEKQIQEYTIYVDSDVAEVSISAIPEDQNATTSINGYNYLTDGNNDATIDVKAADGSVRTYIVHIIKAPEYNSYLKNITVSTGIFWDLTPKFQSTTFEYTTTITSVYDKAVVEAVAVDPTTEISGTGEYQLTTGTNLVTLVATAKDGSTSTYTVSIVKLANNNVDLANLIVEEGNLSPTFDKGTTKYDISVPSDTEKLTIQAIPAEKTSTVTITGNEHLVTGTNLVNIIVMNQDKTASKTYQLTVYKSPSDNNDLDGIKVSHDDTEYPLDPSFNKDALEYRVTVPHDISKVQIEASVHDQNAKVEGVGEEYLSYGGNHKEIVVTSETGTKKTYELTIYREFDLRLKEIVSDYGTLSPTFDPDVLEYQLDLVNEVDAVFLTATPMSNYVTASGSGTYSLDTGKNEITFTVTAPDGQNRNYKVLVNRAKDDNNYIKSLTVSGMMSKAFDKTIQEYGVDVRKDITSLTLDVELESEKATYEVLGNESFTEEKNPNQVTIRVISESGKTRDYVLNVMVRPDEFFSNRLLDLKVNQGTLTPDFNPDINNYAVTVETSISELDLTVVKEDEYATVTGDGKHTLEIGKNVISVEVTSKDGKKNTYYIVVYRKNSADATLSNLIIKNQSYLPIFNRLIESYQMTLDGSVTDLEVIATPTDPNSTVKISGNHNLVTGTNTITILVTAPDGLTKKTYTITVIKNISTNNYLSNLQIVDYVFHETYDKTNLGPYTVDVESSINSVLVEATPEVSSTTVSGTGNVSLVSGQNVISVSATSESGEVRTYTILVNKKKSTDSSLKDILLSDSALDQEFNPKTLSYDVHVPEELDEITVTGVLNDSRSSILGNGTYEISDDFTVSLEVTSESGEKTTYQVHIIRDMEASSKLSKLVVKNGELYPQFHKLITSYTILIPNEVKSLDMDIIPEDQDATYKVTGNENFKLGNNTVKIRVTAKDGSSTTDYIISAVRQAKASNYLSDLEVEGYTLKPTFAKETLYYEVSVPLEVETVMINATSEDPSTVVTGTGYQSLNYGENRFYVTAESTSGIIRSYQVVITRSQSDENKLLTLTSDIGDFDQLFDPDVKEYTLLLPEKTTEITLSGTVSEHANVVGLGKVSIGSSEEDKTITVTSQSGKINTYTIHVKKGFSASTELESLTPSSGKVAYSNSILDYEMEVEDNVTVMSFAAIPKDPDATISGNDITVLNYGENTITIVVTAEDGVTTRTIHIKVTRMKDLQQIILEKDSLVLGVDETLSPSYTLDPIDTNYPEVTWKSLDETIATVDEFGNITGVKLGSTEVEIASKHNPSIVSKVTIHVINKRITSSTYKVNRYTEEEKENDEELLDYLIGLDPKTKLGTLKSSLENEESMVHVFDLSGEEINDTKNIGTGFTIRLIYEEEILDEVTVIVRGDLNGDGLITTPDFTILKNKINNQLNLSFLQTKASDLNKDGKVTTPDFTILKNFINQDISNLN